MYMNVREYAFGILKKIGIRVRRYARGVKNREEKKAGEIINLDILNNDFLGLDTHKSVKGC
jgi:hypothetical protein